jgi:transketolase
VKRSFNYLAKKINLDERSKYLRRNIIQCIEATRRGHIGSAMSLVEILRVLYDDILKYNSKNPNQFKRDKLILSKGHGCLALYSLLADKGFFLKKHLKTTCQFDSILGGHPEYGKVPGVEASTGSLGHGLPIAVGLAISEKLNKTKNYIFVIIGDGELNEGSNWEALLSASKHRLDNLIIMLDYNKIQSYGPTNQVLDLEPISAKIKAFNLFVNEVNGHDLRDIKNRILECKKAKRPSFIICHTIKGKGISFAENNPFWHHKNNLDDETINTLYKEVG